MRREIRMPFKKRNMPWNRGLTRETDERVKKIAEKLEKRRWTKKELNYLIKNYPNNSNIELAKKLKRDYINIINKAKQLKLNKSKEYISKIHSKAGKIGGLKGGKSLIEKRKKDGTFNKFVSKGGLTSIEKFRKDGKLKEWQLKGNIKRCKLYKGTKKIREWTSKGGKRTNELYKGTKRREEWLKKAGKIGGPASFESRRKNSPYTYDKEKFFSKQEMECYKFYKKLGLTKKQINHEFSINGSYFDFFPFKRFFHEHHPIINLDNYDKDRTPKEYFLERRRILDRNNYKGCPLIVTQSLADLNKIEKMVRKFK